MRWPPQSVGVQAALFGAMIGATIGLLSYFRMEAHWFWATTFGIVGGLWAWFKFHQLSEDEAGAADDESDPESRGTPASEARRKRRATSETYTRYFPVFSASSLASVGVVSLAIRTESFTLILLAAVLVTLGHFALRRFLRKKIERAEETR